MGFLILEATKHNEIIIGLESGEEIVIRVKDSFLKQCEKHDVSNRVPLCINAPRNLSVSRRHKEKSSSGY